MLRRMKKLRYEVSFMSDGSVALYWKPHASVPLSLKGQFRSLTAAYRQVMSWVSSSSSINPLDYDLPY